MIKGKENLDKKIREISNLSLKTGVGKAIIFVQGRAVENCPTNDGELRGSIFTSVQDDGESAIGICYTNKEYAPYVELGTGPRGQESHEGISPLLNVSYTQSPWWIHESQVDKGTAEKYHWSYIDTPEGRFYKCTGQAAQPFMYPALKNHEKIVTKIIKDELKKEIGRSLN